MSYIGPNATVTDNASVTDNAQVFGNASVSDHAWVFGNAWVSGNTRVFGNAWVFGNAQVSAGYVGDGAYVSEPHHVQTYRDADDALWTVYRRRKKKPRIMRVYQPVKYREAPAIVRALAAEVAA